jgi:hypothetical protein
MSHRRHLHRHHEVRLILYTMVFYVFPIEVLRRTTKDASSSFSAFRFLATCKLGQASHLGPFPRAYEQGSCCLPSLHAAAQCGPASQPSQPHLALAWSLEGCMAGAPIDQSKLRMTCTKFLHRSFIS